VSIADAIEPDVALSRWTTLQLGGPAAEFVRVDREAGVRDAARYARDRDAPLLVLGEGSNLVVADAGFGGLVVRMDTRGVESRRDGERVLVTAAAGEPWDAFVARAVAEGLSGVECLSGIPGLVGATPIQNVGAYGQEVSDVVVSVRALDREADEVVDVPAADCGFGYRDSAFKRDASSRRIVLAVTFALRPGGAPTVRYAELGRALSDAGNDRPSLADVRDAVLGLRRRKSMVIDPSDENRRSAGSFFTNPIVSAAEADRVVGVAVRAGLARSAAEVPRWEAAGGVKLAAGWLVERSGTRKGERRGAVGVSTRHALALVHHGGGTTAELLAFADEVRRRVRSTFGVDLAMEPVCVGRALP
jgi:UDP-N-acetylmuramate dehydrogenase